MDDMARPEADVFGDLQDLCTAKGYIHVFAYFCYRDCFIRYRDTLKAEDYQQSFEPSRLIRSELSTLLGLLIKGKIDCSILAPELFQQYVEQTERLLAELHMSIASPMVQGIQGLTPESFEQDLLSRGPVLREPIFYGGDSAYRSQYRDFSARKYRQDDPWLTAARGFTIEQAVGVAEAIHSLQPSRLAEFQESIAVTHPDSWTVLPYFIFRSEEVAKAVSVASAPSCSAERMCG